MHPNRDFGSVFVAQQIMMQMWRCSPSSERATVREYRKAGLQSARKRGRIGGRRPKLRPQQQVEIIRNRLANHPGSGCQFSTRGFLFRWLLSEKKRPDTRR
jgi:hypothetical protein